MSTAATVPTATMPNATLTFYPQQKARFRVYALWHFTTFMLCWHLIGQSFLGFEQAWIFPITTIGTACLTQFFLEWLDAKVKRRRPRYAGGWANFINLFPPAFIVGGALGMLLYSNELVAPAVFAAVISIASKVLIRVRLPNGMTQHVFNPSNFGICAALYLFPDIVGVAPPYHFTENLTGAWHWAVPCVILTSGLILHYRATGRLPLCATWIVAYAGQAVFRAWLEGVPWYVPMMPMSSAAFIIFTLYMIPDPATSPLVWWRQVLFAIAVAALYGIIQLTHNVFGLFLALFLVCMVRGVSIEVYTRFFQRKEPALAQANAAMAYA